MSLRSDCLLAVTGIRPTTITVEDHARALEIPQRFASRLGSWVRTEEARPFEYREPYRDMEALFQSLAMPPAELEVTGWMDAAGIEDPEMVAGYVPGLLRARAHIVEAWPKIIADTGAGPEVLPLSEDDAEQMHSLYLVLDRPERVIDEMFSWTLTPSQALAFRTCYPALYDHCSKALQAELTVRRARSKEWHLGWEREAVLRTLKGLPPEPQNEPPPPPEPKPSKLEVAKVADQGRTQADLSARPRAAK